MHFMHGHRPLWRRLRAKILCGLAAPVLLSLNDPGFAADPMPEGLPAPAAKAPAKEEAPLSLLACRQMALEKQPAVAAARASLAAAEARARAVERLCLASLISRDLPVRRKQASLGLSIAQATLVQAEGDAVHGVTFSYLSVLYAQKQRRAAADAIARLELRRQSAAGLLTRNWKGVSKQTVDKLDLYLLIAQARREEADLGYERALSALREAIGLEQGCPVVVETSEIEVVAPPSLEQVVAEALARRGEVAQAAGAAEVNCLEVDAQNRVRFRLAVNTFAAASDIHAHNIPAGEHSDTYRPGAIPPEMPVLLPGKQHDRLDQARAYYGRAEAVAEKVRNLIALEAEQAYLRWREADNKASKLQPAAKKAEELADSLDRRFRDQGEMGGAVTFDEVTNGAVLGAQTTVSANQADYQRLLELAALERATASGYNPGWKQLPAAPTDPPPGE
jgi:outer membrane protein TolC